MKVWYCRWFLAHDKLMELFSVFLRFNFVRSSKYIESVFVYITGVQERLPLSSLPVLHHLLVRARVVDQRHRAVWLYCGADGASTAVHTVHSVPTNCRIPRPRSHYRHQRRPGGLCMKCVCLCVCVWCLLCMFVCACFCMCACSSQPLT